jgi:hypothetical protein
MVLETLPSQGDIQDFHCDPTPYRPRRGHLSSRGLSMEPSQLIWGDARGLLLTLSLVTAAEKDILTWERPWSVVAFVTYYMHD